MFLPFPIHIHVSDDLLKPDVLNAFAALFSSVIAFFAFFVSVVVAWLTFRTVQYQRVMSKDQKQVAQDQKQAAEYQRLSTSATLIAHLLNTYDSVEMKGHRQYLAKRLLNENQKKLINLTLSEPVLGFFEDLAYLTCKKILDEEMVWNMFFPALECYYFSLTNPENLIKKAQDDRNSKTLYREVTCLFGKLTKLDAHQDGKAAYEPPADIIKVYLSKESALIIESPSKLKK